MLQMVPLPVQLKLIAPSPKYSIILSVPPLTVSIPATFRITSFALAQPFNLPVSDYNSPLLQYDSYDGKMNERLDQIKQIEKYISRMPG
jgi:hypothetical protein